MRVRIQLAAVGAALAAVSATAQEQAARPLPYDYMFANYALTELDSGGIEIGGSIEVADRVQVFGAYQDWELDGDFDREAFHVGAGYQWAMSPRTDFIAKLAYADTELERSGQPDLDEQGLVLSGEIRGWVGERLELSGELLLDDSLDDLETVLEFGAQYHTRSTFSFGGRFRIDEEDTTLLLGARFYFGPSAR